MTGRSAAGPAHPDACIHLLVFPPCPPGRPLQARLDRVLGRLPDWEPLAVEMVGQEPIPGLTRVVRTGKTARSDKTIPVWPRWVAAAACSGLVCRACAVNFGAFLLLGPGSRLTAMCPAFRVGPCSDHFGLYAVFGRRSAAGGSGG